jgi:hypothetical protein
MHYDKTSIAASSGTTKIYKDHTNSHFGFVGSRSCADIQKCTIIGLSRRSYEHIFDLCKLRWLYSVRIRKTVARGAHGYAAVPTYTCTTETHSVAFRGLREVTFLKDLDTCAYNLILTFFNAWSARQNLNIRPPCIVCVADGAMLMRVLSPLRWDDGITFKYKLPLTFGYRHLSGWFKI